MYCGESSQWRRRYGSPQRILVKDTKMLATWTGTTISHIFRQANQTADWLARLGAEQYESLVVTEQVPLTAREYVIADCLGVGHLRT